MKCSFKVVTKAFWKNFELRIFESVYDPSEDSFLLADALPELQGKTFLDLGCGSGIQSVAAASKGCTNITAVDANDLAVHNVQFNMIEHFPNQFIQAIQSNWFEKLGGKKFDVIAFNPPYVPSEGKADIRLDGGKTGRDPLDNILAQADGYLNPNGMIFFLQTNINDENLTIQKWGKKWALEKVAEKRIFFEELSVWKATIISGN